MLFALKIRKIPVYFVDILLSKWYNMDGKHLTGKKSLTGKCHTNAI